MKVRLNFNKYSMTLQDKNAAINMKRDVYLRKYTHETWNPSHVYTAVSILDDQPRHPPLPPSLPSAPVA